MPPVRREVVFSAAAQRDLEGIFDFIAADDISAAEKELLKIIETCLSLDRLAERGQLRSDLAPGLRQIVVGSYVAFYRRQGPMIQVIRVLHGRRNAARIFRRGH